MSIIRKKFVAVLVALMCVMLAISAIVLYLPKSITANAAYNADSYLTISEIWNGGDGNPFNGDNLQALYAALTGKNNADFSDVEDLVNNDLDVNGDKSVNSDYFRQVNEEKNIEVTFNGIKWAAVQLNVTRDAYSDGTRNKTNKGSIILTLWQSDDLKDANNALVKSKFSEFTNSSSGDYPSSMYSTSYIRVHTLNAGGYSATDNMTIPSSKHTPQENNLYARFTMKGVTNSCVDFLVKPKDVEYQEFESQALTANIDNCFLPNEAYGLDPTKYSAWEYLSKYYGAKDGEGQYYGFYNPTQYSFLSKGDPERPESKYSDWQNDYLWLPSIAETGYTDSSFSSNGYDINRRGLWRTNISLRSHDSNSVYAWLRGNYSAFSNDVLALQENGGNWQRPNSNTEYGVRPALHLNLTAASTGKPPKGAVSKPTDLNKKLVYNGVIQEFDLSIYDDLEFSSSANFDTATKKLFGKNVNTYTVTAFPADGAEWDDEDGGGNAPVTFTLKINKKPIELEIELSSYTHEVGKPPASITAGIKSPGDGVFAACDNWEELCKGVQFSVTGGKSVEDLLNAAVGSYTVSATLVLDNYEVTLKSATYTVASHSTHKYDGEAEHIAGTKMHKVYCSYDGCSEYDTKPCDITSETPHEETCLLDGYTEYVCSGCGVYTIKGANKKAHDFTDQPWVTDDNQHWHECSYGCNTTDTKADHRWQQKGEIVWDDDSGTRTDECKDCGKTRQITVYPGEKPVPALKDKTYIYNGNAQEAELSDFEAGAMTLEYYDEYKSNNLGGAPAGAGKYYVKVTLTEAGSKFQGIEERFVWIEFVIQKKAIILEIELSGTGHEIGNAPESITASIKTPSSGVFVDGDDWEMLCKGVQFTVTDCNVLEDLINAAVGSYEVNAILVLDNYDVTVKPVKYEIVAHEHRFDGQDWQSDENTHWHDCVQGDAKGDESAHDWDKGTITREATEEQAGERTFTCETCGATRTEAVEYVPPEDNIKDKRQEAKDALDEVAQKKKDEIDNSDMSDEEKEAAKKKVDEELQKGNEAIDSATSSSGIDSVFNESKKNIENIAIKGSGSLFPWWIIAVVAGLLLAATAVIIIVVKKRQAADGEDEYDDFYDDEYDFEEAIEENFDDEDF